MAMYKCDVCNKFEYDDEKGMDGISPGTKPHDFPRDWKCPICQADKTHMILDDKKEDNPNNITASDVIVETLIEWGVDTVFGMVGHSNLGLANAIRKQEEKRKLRYTGIRHEGAGAFAASAYGKLTGKPAVCFSIAGPGGLPVPYLLDNSLPTEATAIFMLSPLPLVFPQTISGVSLLQTTPHPQLLISLSRPVRSYISKIHGRWHSHPTPSCSGSPPHEHDKLRMCCAWPD